MPTINSPLRYPGGKTKALRQIVAFLPAQFASYRKPFVGGGSLFIHLKQQRPQLPVWINDLNYDLYCF
jgi:DNA adenine methylase